MKLPFKQEIAVDNQVVAVRTTDHTVGETRSVGVFTPELDHSRSYRVFVDLGTGLGAWKRVEQ
jgi:hypothetical protein